MDQDQTAALIALGLRIKEIRKAQRMTQSQLAFEAGLEIRQIQRLEKGTANMGIANLLKIALVLDIRLEVLFQGI